MKWLYFFSGVFAMMFIGHLHEEFYEEQDFRAMTYFIAAVKLLASVLAYKLAETFK